MVKVFIDGQEIVVEQGTTVFMAAKKAGITIPHLCFHPAFAPEGSCRMCLVEIEGLPKLELACSTVVREGMKVSTQSEAVVEARKGVLEFLLADHPLDCPICDKAGECKLQDYYEAFGLFSSQFEETKEKREKKVKIGMSLLHDQERCVLCRRCVRFLDEVTRTQELGVFERGVHAQINILEGIPINNNYSGNLAQICPVGAITDSDFRFQTRSWFLDKKDSICSLCSRGCNIVIESHKGFARFPVPKRIYRVMSRENPEVNGFWICDVGRYGYSDLDANRLDRIKSNNGASREVNTWDNVLGLMADKIKQLSIMNRTNRIALILNTCLSNEELFLIRKMFVEELKVEKMFFVDPPDGEEDGFLMTAERTPNKRGALELGFDDKPLDVEAFQDKTELALIFGAFVSEHPDFGALSAALGGIATKILLTPHTGPAERVVDRVLPVALIAEKSGSLTNVDGIVQRFTPAVSYLGESRPEWRILVDIAKAVGINFRYYSRLISLEAVTARMCEEISFFRK